MINDELIVWNISFIPGISGKKFLDAIAELRPDIVTFGSDYILQKLYANSRMTSRYSLTEADALMIALKSGATVERFFK